MVNLRNLTMLKYMVSIRKTAMYLEFMAEIHHHIEVENNSNLETSKLSKDVQLGGKHKLNTRINAPKQIGNGKETKMERKGRMRIKEEIIESKIK